MNGLTPRRRRRTAPDQPEAGLGGSEDGTVLLLSLGLCLVAMLLVWAVIDVSVIYLDRRALTGAVDGAALAGAQQVDRSRLYETGIPTVGSGPLPLAPTAALDAVARYATTNYPPAHYPGWQLTASPTDGDRAIRVRGQIRVSLPVFGSVTVTAQAVAVTATN